MPEPKIAIVVGNGFSMSFGYHSGLANQWDSQKPLGWEINCPSNEGLLINSLPQLKKLKEKYHNISDFDLFAKSIDTNTCNDLQLDQFITTLEARHFLTIAFSEYTLKQNSLLSENKSWPWYKWLKTHCNEITCSYSLNYDLLLESVFNEIKKEHFSLQINHHGYGIPLVKPHGSVDFEISPNSISYKAQYPLNNYVDLNDTPIIKLETDSLIYPRSQALCIVPNESNKYKKYQWVAPANEWFKEVLSSCTHCVFIGISYFECDQPEIDEIIANIPINSEIIVANTNPPKDFLTKLGDRPTLIWDSHKGPVDTKGKIMLLKNINTGNSLTKCFCRSGLSYKYCCGAKIS